MPKGGQERDGELGGSPPAAVLRKRGQRSADPPGRGDHGPGQAATAWALLRTDPVVQAAGVVVLTAVALRSLARTGDQLFYLEIGADLALVLLTIVALLAGLGKLPTREERRFWTVLAYGFAAWAAVLALYLSIPDSWWSTGFNLAVDSLYLIFYLFLLAAVDRRPDLRLERRILSIGGRYRLPGAMIFSVGVFLYFVVVPAVLSPELYQSLSPSMVLFLALDLYLMIRLLILSRVARTARWRRCFFLTATVAWFFLIADMAELLVILELLPGEPGVLSEALLLVPSIGVIATVRLRALPVAVKEGASSETGWTSVETLAQGAPFLAYAFFLPLVHFAAYRATLFDELTRPVHENLVLIWLFCLGVVALVQYLDLERRHHSLLDQRRLTEERLWHLANFDQLTGLPNRILFRDRLSHAIKQAQRTQRLVAIVFSDLDDFKQVNDSYGHAAGDELLRCVARRMVRSVRDSDTVARLGGDEFTVLLESLDDGAHVERLTRRISLALSAPFEVGDHVVTLGSCLGVGIYPHDGEDVDTLLASADAAMYEGKRSRESGRSKIRWHSKTVGVD